MYNHSIDSLPCALSCLDNPSFLLKLLFSMRLEDLNWFDIENYLKTDDRLMLVIGACEQHGYLSLTADSKIPLALADAASQQTGVLVAGSISLRIATLMDVVEDILRSIHRQGFRRLLILNGHGGNDPIRTRLAEIIDTLPGLQIAWYSWWNAANVTAVAANHGLKSYHAAWIEAFPFTRVSELPPGEKIPQSCRNYLAPKKPAKPTGMVFSAVLIKLMGPFSMKYSRLRSRIL